MGQGLQWGTKQFYSDDSIDAKLLGCACCGMREYKSKSDPTAKTKFDYFHVNRLDILKLTKEDSQDYKEKLKIELLLPVNDEGHCKKFVPWKTKKCFYS